MGGRLMGGQTLPALLQIDQRDLNRGGFTFTGYTHEHVLDVQATVLPTALVHARQVFRQLLQDSIMHRLTVTLAAATGIPVFDLFEAVQ
ncbi:hypothetical protein D3C85_1496980 [compost metagenome]